MTSFFKLSLAAFALCASTASAQQFSDRERFIIAGPLTEDRVLVGQNKVQYACRLTYLRNAAVVSDCVTFQAGRVSNTTNTDPDRQPTEPLPDLAAQVARIDDIAAANMALEVLNKLTCQAGAKSVPSQLYRTQLRDRLLRDLGAPTRLNNATKAALDEKIRESTRIVFKYNRAEWLIDEQFIGPTRCQ